MKKKKYKKNLIICVPHSMHARNLFSSSFDFKRVSVIYGNFSPEVKNFLKKKTLCKIKNFNFLHVFQSKLISLYTILLDINKKDNRFIKLLKKNFYSSDLKFKKTFKYKINNFQNIFFFKLAKFSGIKFLLEILIIIFSLILFSYTIIRYKPKKIFFMCSNSFIDKGLFFLAKIMNLKIYGLISSWDHLTTKRFVDINKFHKLFIWNDYFKKELKKDFNFDLRKADSVGFPYYDAFKKKYSTENFITFFMPNPSMMEMSDQIEVLSFLNNYCKEKKLSLFVKPHPGINYKNIFKKFKNKRIKFIVPKNISMNLNKKIYDKTFFDEDLNKIIQKSKVIINFHSTTSLDAIYYLKPVINLSLRKENHWLYEIPYYKFVLGFNAISIANTSMKLKILLNRYLGNPKMNYNNRIKLKKYYFGKYNPYSGKLMSDIINRN